MSYLDVIACANTADLNEYVPLYIEAEQVGMLWRPNISLLQDYGLLLTSTARGLEWQGFADFNKNSVFLQAMCQRMANDELVPGWRNELFSLSHDFHSKIHAVIERAALPYFGACGYGVHINGLTKKDNTTHMWLAKRALNKPTDPGKLDQIAAGGLPYGLSAFDNMMKECEEEAAIPNEWSKTAIAVSSVSYLRQTTIGIRSDVMFNYDLWLPAEFEPTCNDGEVAEFMCLPIVEVMDLVLNADSLKFNSALVIIDFLLRHGYITPAHKDYQLICALLTQRELRLSVWLKNNFLDAEYHH